MNDCLYCAENESAIESLRASLAAAEAQINRGLDYEHHSSCGHVWTMRHTACPECMAAVKKERDAARAEAARLRDLLLDGLSHGIDDYWITTAEGVEWRERVKAALDGGEGR